MSETQTRPAPLGNATASELRGVRGVCLDIDDTLSTEGKLTAEAYEALWSLKRAGFAVVPITGRPAGWCDHFARFWPVDAVVGENGAFTFFMEGGVRRRINTPPGAGGSGGATLELVQARLKDLGEKIHARFPHARWASDQAYREYDLAIDICEDVPTWPREDIDELLALCANAGAHAKLSSIHVNAWFGDYDKRRGFEYWLETSGKFPALGEWLFIGDSPNDEPMFGAFRHTVGVANLGRYLDRLKTPPRWITPSASGAGFAEMAAALIAARSG
jgi:hydroxymethylpyrimidine pyrophosphatase-like HAD family hydrolase